MVQEKNAVNAEDNHVEDVNKSAFEKYGINKPPLVDFKTMGFFENYLYLFGKKIIDLGKKKSFEKEDMWKLPKDWTTEELYPNFKAYFDKNYNDPNCKNSFEGVLFKYVSA
jgi:hypothetical protein